MTDKINLIKSKLTKSVCQFLNVYEVPSNLDSILTQFTQRGFRVLALATRNVRVKIEQESTSLVEELEKELKPKLGFSLQKGDKTIKIGSNREEFEKKLDFLGLLVMENKVKTATPPVIKQLQEASIRTLMVTGKSFRK